MVPRKARGGSFKNEVVLLDATMRMPKRPFGFGNKKFFRELIKRRFCRLGGGQNVRLHRLGE